MPARRELADHVIVAPSRPGFEAYLAGARALLAWERDAAVQFGVAIAADPTLAVAHAGLALAHFSDERYAQARSAIASARAAAVAADERQRSHVDAIALLVEGKHESIAHLRAHVTSHPRDLVIAQRLYLTLFWQGRARDLLDLAVELRGHPAHDGFLLGMHAFALTEVGRCREAAALAGQALAGDPGDAWAIHALAHALHESGELDRAEARVPAAIATCPRVGWFGNHITWHLMLLRLARGDYEAVERHARAVAATSPSRISDLDDTLSLLWRLELHARACPDAWPPLADVARQRLDHTFLFHCAHLAMALAAVHDGDAANRQIAALERASAGSREIGEVALPLIHGIHAFAAGDYDRTIAVIEPVRRRIVELGGSRLQRDVFHDTLLEACFRANQLDRARSLLAERTSERPAEQFWKRRGAAQLLAQ